ncbi:hypothetical protein MC885_002355 [Smutsia gigantea]|nr:hypothetical protein MC885_002355 [Smutsia gigantea]
MLQLVRAGAQGWLRLGCRSLNALAEEAVQQAEKPEPVASAGACAAQVRAPGIPAPTSGTGLDRVPAGLRAGARGSSRAAPRSFLYSAQSYAKTKTRAEVQGGGRKPWPQKGSGRARHGSIRSPIWRGGGIAHGPRGPTSYYYMLPMKVRVQGLKVALTVKLAQDDLRIVDSLELPTADPQYLTELARYRRWGDSVLLVDLAHEDMPQNVVAATSKLKTFNLVPAVGLNVHSMLKHQTLVLTLQTVAFLEEKLLWQDSRYTPLYPFRLPYRDFP